MIFWRWYSQMKGKNMKFLLKKTLQPKVQNSKKKKWKKLKWQNKFEVIFVYFRSKIQIFRGRGIQPPYNVYIGGNMLIPVILSHNTVECMGINWCLLRNGLNVLMYAFHSELYDVLLKILHFDGIDVNATEM